MVPSHTLRRIEYRPRSAIWVDLDDRDGAAVAIHECPIIRADMSWESSDRPPCVALSMSAKDISSGQKLRCLHRPTSDAVTNPLETHDRSTSFVSDKSPRLGLCRAASLTSRQRVEVRGCPLRSEGAVNSTIAVGESRPSIHCESALSEGIT
jgi:hypothetical protein